jgi:hypothetical protein
MFSYDELMKKSVGELNAMLADDSLFPLGETANADLIERICDVISEKENVPSRRIKAEDKKAWNSFRKKYITPDSKKATPGTEIIEIKKPKKYSFTPVFTALAAAAIVILVVKIPAQSPETPPADITVTDSAEIERTADVKLEENSFSSWNIGFDGLPDGYELVAEGGISYNDNSEKQYTIYSSGEKMFFISILTNTSEDINAPSKNEIHPFDIFEDANIDDAKIKNGNEIFRTWTIGDTKIVTGGNFSDEEVEKLNYTVIFNKTPSQ